MKYQSTKGCGAREGRERACGHERGETSKSGKYEDAGSARLVAAAMAPFRTGLGFLLPCRAAEPIALPPTSSVGAAHSSSSSSKQQQQQQAAASSKQQQAAASSSIAAAAACTSATRNEGVSFRPRPSCEAFTTHCWLILLRSLFRLQSSNDKPWSGEGGVMTSRFSIFPFFWWPVATPQLATM